MFRRVGIFVVVFQNPLRSSAQQNGCPLDCRNGGKCAFGTADFRYHTDSFVDKENVPWWIQERSNSGMHCICPPGWTGLRCEHEYETCANSKSNHKCYHGSKCVAETMRDQFGNPQYTCDCSEANLNAADGDFYAGWHCEHLGTMKCSDDTDPSMFCVHGECRDHISELGSWCDCYDGFVGPHCEFREGHTPECVLQCKNGGACKIGVDSYDEAQMVWDSPFSPMQQEWQYCTCSEGFTGPRCEVQVEPCGEHQCYHGSKCVTVQNEQGEEKKYCDCTAANNALKSYVGDFCEHESSSHCTKSPDHNGMTFCTNGGTCGDETHKPCECESGFTGYACQYEETKPQTCNKKCLNGGECRKGPKDYGIHAGFDALNERHDANFEHCVCPSGFTGVECEIEVETCGEEGGHVCLHGSVCIKGEENTYKCKCELAYTNSSQFAGAHCEHESNQLCYASGLGVISESKAFCTNGGRCMAIVDEPTNQHPGCDCPDEFTGDHCEIKKDSIEDNVDSGRDPEATAITIALVILVAMLAVLTVVAFILAMRLTRGRVKETKQVEEVPATICSDSLYESDGWAYPGTYSEGDEDGEMENVEII